MTKQQEQFYQNYRWAEHESVRTAYKNPSWRKVRAEEIILDEMKKYNGYDYYVTYANCQHFGCAFKYKDKDGNERLRYYTGYRVDDFEV